MQIIVIADNLSGARKPNGFSVKMYQQMCMRLVKAAQKNLFGFPSKRTEGLDLPAIFARSTVQIILSSGLQMQKLNYKWRKKNQTTDVLSFPLSLDEPDGAIPWILGEIYINLEQARHQAAKYEHTFKRELAFLTVHGWLHLLGFDHKKPADEKDMFCRQEAILSAAGYPRSRLEKRSGS